ncbi:MAG: T9SS type A sorting domain-containing protein [Salibacteraceae bacterium]
MRLSHFLLASLLSVGLFSCSSDSKHQVSKRETGIAGRADYELNRLKDPKTGAIPDNIRMKELAFASTLPKSNSRNNKVSDQVFEPIGPYNVGGRTRAIAFDVTLPNVVLAGGVSGGMWRSTDFGQSWSRATNYEDQSAVSCVIQDVRPGKENIFYYGSGESVGNSASKSFSAYYYGSGMYKSIDHGATWTQMPSTATPVQKGNQWSYIFNIAMDPSNLVEDELYAATSRGIQRSVDGGNSWTLVLGGAINADWSEIEITSTGVCYAHISSDGAQSGFWRSVDGTNWVNISPNDLPSNHERTLIASAPSNENVVYYYTETPGSGLSDVSFWKYTYQNGNGSGSGGVWQNRSSKLPPARGYSLNTQGNYCMSLAVKPTNENMVYLGATNLFRSSNGFNTTSGMSQIGGYDADGYSNFNYYRDNQHPDQQSIIFKPSNANHMLASTDGGLHFTTNPEASKVIWESFNNGFQTTQFYGLGIDHEEENETVISGYQDNGSWVTVHADTLTDWTFSQGGDGAFCAIEGGSNVLYASSQNGNISRHKINQNGETTSIKRNIRPNNTSNYLFNHPFILDPSDNNKMYLPEGGNIWRNSNLSALDNNQELWTNIGSVSGTITAINASKSTPGVVYVGTSGKNIYKVIDNGGPNATITNITTGITNGSYTSNIEVDPENANNVLVVYSNYNVISMWSSTDGGATWSNVEGNLKGESEPGTPPSLSYIGDGPSFRWAKFIKTQNGDAVLLGTSIGLFATNTLDGENTEWIQQAPDVIGNIVIEQIDYRESDGFCVVGTHGAGAFKTYFSNNWDITAIETIDAEELKINIYPNPVVSTATLSFENPGNEKVQVRVLNGAGQVLHSHYLTTSNGQNQTEINVSEYTQGIYYITLYTNQGNFTKTFIKQ